MKKITYIVVAAIVVLLIGFGVVQTVRCGKFIHKYDVAMQNSKAYESQLDILNEKNKVFQFTVQQLKYTNDSSIRQMDSMRRELGIKDKKIKLMGKIREYVYVHDSIFVHDTIFSDPDFVIDTCVGDGWHETCIHMEYPNKVSSETSFNTDLSVFLHTIRETVNPPCKTWIGRLFQKKHDVYNVTVIENNPYAKIKENKFVIINNK